MRLLFLIVILLFTTASNAFEIARSGQTVVIKSACFGFNIDAVINGIPEGVTRKEALAAIIVTGMRDLTEKEKLLCEGKDPTPDVPEAWRVAYNNGIMSRPVKWLDANWVRHDVTQTAVVGELCGDSKVYSEPAGDGLEWRFLAGQTRYVVICEYK